MVATTQRAMAMICLGLMVGNVRVSCAQGMVNTSCALHSSVWQQVNSTAESNLAKGVEGRDRYWTVFGMFLVLIFRGGARRAANLSPEFHPCGDDENVRRVVAAAFKVFGGRKVMVVCPGSCAYDREREQTGMI